MEPRACIPLKLLHLFLDIRTHLVLLSNDWEWMGSDSNWVHQLRQCQLTLLTVKVLVSLCHFVGNLKYLVLCVNVGDSFYWQARCYAVLQNDVISCFFLGNHEYTALSKLTTCHLNVSMLTFQFEIWDLHITFGMISFPASCFVWQHTIVVFSVCKNHQQKHWIWWQLII